jgi:hypothetical protein
MSPKLKFLAKGNNLKNCNPAKVPNRAPDHVPRYMTDTKRTKLEAIRDNNNKKARKERMRNIIAKKMISVFGMRNVGIIDSFVDEFVQTRDESINSSDLKRLENELRGIIGHHVAAPPRVKSEEVVCMKEEVPEVPPSQPLPLESGIAWKAINAYEAAVSELEEKERRLKDIQKKSRLKAELQKQMEVAKKMQEVDRRSDVVYAAHVLEDVGRYREEEERKQREIAEKAAIQKRFREEQIAQQAQRKEEEREQARQHELANLAACQAALDAEAAAAQERKAEGADRQRRMLLENERLRLMRLEQKQQDAEYDQKLMREYAEKMDREAAEREAAFSKRMANQEAHAAKFANDGAGKVARENQLREERLLLAEQERKEKADAAEELRRKMAARQRQQDAARVNLNMIKEQQERAQRERERDQRLIRMAEDNLQDWRKSEENKLRKEAERKIKFKSALTAQIQERGREKQLGDMTDIEYVINKQTLAAIATAPPAIKDAIKKRLQL